MPVDMSTLLLMFPVVALSMALAILIVALGRWNDDGLAHWGSSLLMLALAFPLFVVHGHMVGLSPLLVVFGNVLLAGSYALALVAVCLFFGRPRPSWRALAPVGLAAAGSAVFIEQADVRVALGGVLFGVQGFTDFRNRSEAVATVDGRSGTGAHDTTGRRKAQTGRPGDAPCPGPRRVAAASRPGPLPQGVRPIGDRSGGSVGGVF